MDLPDFVKFHYEEFLNNLANPHASRSFGVVLLERIVGAYGPVD